MKRHHMQKLGGALDPPENKVILLCHHCSCSYYEYKFHLIWGYFLAAWVIAALGEFQVALCASSVGKRWTCLSLEEFLLIEIWTKRISAGPAVLLSPSCCPSTGSPQLVFSLLPKLYHFILWGNRTPMDLFKEKEYCSENFLLTLFHACSGWSSALLPKWKAICMWRTTKNLQSQVVGLFIKEIASW